jgi:hypothetical protein
VKEKTQRSKEARKKRGGAPLLQGVHCWRCPRIQKKEPQFYLTVIIALCSKKSIGNYFP